MPARPIGRPNPTSQARLQLILVLLAAWNIIAFIFELLNAGPLRVAGVEGILGARALGGTTGVLAMAYIVAARDPLRHRFVLWIATVEQVLLVFTAGFHWARGDFGAGEAWLPITVATAFLVLLLTSLPRQADTG